MLLEHVWSISAGMRDSLSIPSGEVGMRHDLAHRVSFILGLHIDGGISALSVFEHGLHQPVLAPE